MLTLRDCQNAARALRNKLNRLLGARGSYHTSSAWAQWMYVELKYNLFRMVDENGNPGMFVIDYDADAVESEIRRICNQFGIDENHWGWTHSEKNIEITFHSEESKK